MDCRAPSGPRPRFGCEGSWLMASLLKISSRSFRLCLLKPSSTRRRTVDLFWSVLMLPPNYFAVNDERVVRRGPGGHLAGTGARAVRWVRRNMMSLVSILANTMAQSSSLEMSRGTRAREQEQEPWTRPCPGKGLVGGALLLIQDPLEFVATPRETLGRGLAGTG